MATPIIQSIRAQRKADGTGLPPPWPVQPPACPPRPGAGDHGHRPRAAHRRAPHAGTGEAFRDLGKGYLNQVARKRSTTKLVQRLSNLGYDVMLVLKAA